MSVELRSHAYQPAHLPPVAQIFGSPAGPRVVAPLLVWWRGAGAGGQRHNKYACYLGMLAAISTETPRAQEIGREITLQ